MNELKAICLFLACCAFGVIIAVGLSWLYAVMPEVLQILGLLLLTVGWGAVAYRSLCGWLKGRKS